MTRNNIIVLVIILIIFGFSLWTILPIDGERLGRKGLNLGLDLVGGVHLVYQADFADNATAESKDADMKRAVLTIEQRIDKYGVTEPIIQRVGDDRILVQLPGFTDIDAAKSLVEQTGYLEFREVELNDQGNPVYLSDYLDMSSLEFVDKSDNEYRIFIEEYVDQTGKYELITRAFLEQDESGIRFTDPSGAPVDSESLREYSGSISWIVARGDDGTPLSGDLLSDAQARVDQSGVVPEYVVGIQWNSQGTEIFNQIAARLYERREGSKQRNLGILLDDTMLSNPQIRERHYEGGSAVIEGNFTPEQVEELSNLLASGALPMPLKQPPLFQEKVSATLGANFINMSWLAGLIGIVLVMLFMMAYYRAPGFLASLSLVFYGVLMLALFKLIPVTLSLASLGGFIVSIGMAVDANVLIFERMKEELRGGRTLGAAVETGFKRAWSAIWDSNVTTIIVCIILFWLGSSIVASAPVMGFALTLGIGVVASMFTAIIVTRTLLRSIIHSTVAHRTELFTVIGGRK
jgi:protein-export membrane protein SecD